MKLSRRNLLGSLVGAAIAPTLPALPAPAEIDPDPPIYTLADFGEESGSSIWMVQWGPGTVHGWRPQASMEELTQAMYRVFQLSSCR